MLKRLFVALMSTVCVSLGCGPVQPYAGPGEMAEPVDAARYDAAAAIRVLSDVGGSSGERLPVQSQPRLRVRRRKRAPHEAFVTAARAKGAEGASATSRRLMSASVT